MKKINELIKKLCPNGVEYKKLDELCPVMRGKRLTKSQLSENEKYVVYHGSKDTPLGYYNDYNVEGDTVIVVNTGGIGGVKYVNENFWCSDGSFWIKHNEKINNKFLYYYLVQFEDYYFSQKRVGGVPTIDRSVVSDTKIPVLPIDIQCEIVRILDNFTSLLEELERELGVRKKQYEFYQNKLFDFDDKVEYLPLEKIADIGTGSSNTNEAVENGEYPFFVRSQQLYRKNTYEYDETAIITSGDGVGVGKIFHYVEGKYALHQRAYRIHITSDKVIPKYFYFYMKATFYNYIMKNAFNSSVTSVRRPMLNKYPVPIPSIKEQEKIIKILDNFDTLNNDIYCGIPAEIAARKKQYEYYRSNLLTFKELKVSEV